MSNSAKTRPDFTCTVFPTAEDMKLWHALSPEEQRDHILRDVREGLEGPAAERQSKEEIMASVLAKYADAG